jgi:hypothetical protein
MIDRKNPPPAVSSHGTHSPRPVLPKVRNFPRFFRRHASLAPTGALVCSPTTASALDATRTTAWEFSCRCPIVSGHRVSPGSSCPTSPTTVHPMWSALLSGCRREEATVDCCAPPTGGPSAAANNSPGRREEATIDC